MRYITVVKPCGMCMHDLDTRFGHVLCVLYHLEIIGKLTVGKLTALLKPYSSKKLSGS